MMSPQTGRRFGYSFQKEEYGAEAFLGQLVPRSSSPQRRGRYYAKEAKGGGLGKGESTA